MNGMRWLVLLLSVALHAQTVPAVPATQAAATVAPDRFWCPMHPNVRSPLEGSCPICRMTLVPIPPPTVGEYRMDVTPHAAGRGGGFDGLRLAFYEPGSNRPAPAFVTVHEKPLHLFIVGRDLEYFAHLHPEETGGATFDLRHDIPPGEYMVIADFVASNGTPQTLQRAIVTPGRNVSQPVRTPVPHASGAGAVTATDVKVTMEARDLAAGKFASLRFAVADATTGAPVTDMEPYLAAPAHVLLVSADLTYATHGHPDEENTRGPIVSFDLLMPVPGFYKVWLQVQRRGRVQTLPFVVQVK